MLSVAVYSLIGMLTIPNEIAPRQIARGMCCPLVAGRDAPGERACGYLRGIEYRTLWPRLRRGQRHRRSTTLRIAAAP
ncbi:MAG: hypothetical protein AMXMBFR23_22020 [Chloroflexota bacterium]